MNNLMLETSATRSPSQRWPWLLFSVTILAIVLFPSPGLAGPPAERHFRIEASSFAYNPAVLQVNQGDRVTLEVVAADVVHGIYIDGYGVQVTADPGQTQRISFVADRPGSFRYRCSVTCGPLHPFMIGKFNVGPNWLFLKTLGVAVLVAVAGLWSVRK
jgi:heme/copper-type cytochrome/quinol oxidase subunit 2